jgi:Tesmin/TSO1-like CXC domain, cysteine-rich domain
MERGEDKNSSGDGFNEGWATTESNQLNYATTGLYVDVKPKTNGRENPNDTLLPEERKTGESIEFHRSISWEDHYNPNLQTSNRGVFESKPTTDTGTYYPMPPPLKKRLSSGFSLGLGLPGWSNGSLDGNLTMDNSSYDHSSIGQHQTPRPRQRFSIGAPLSTLPHSSAWTGFSKFLSDPLIDTPCPKLYYGNPGGHQPPYGNLGGHQTPLADLGFGGGGFGAIGGTWNKRGSDGLFRRGSMPGASWTGGAFPFQTREPPFASTLPYARDSKQPRSIYESNAATLKREHPSDITNVMLDGHIFKVRRVVDCANHASGNVPHFDNFVTVGVDPYQLQAAQQGSFASHFGQHGLTSIDGGSQELPLVRASMHTEPSVSFDSLSHSSNKDASLVQGCICKRSRCLKLYCKCFQTSKYCDIEACRCKGCRNTNEFDGPGGERSIAIKSITARRNDAFEVRPTKKSGEGCACKKNR